MNLGFVSLIGAGPGHSDYMSVKGLRRLQEADVILYDALIGEDIVSLFPKGSIRLFCGKRCGRHSFTQENINHWIIHYAKRGMRVARLKGGDPYIFGRGGEEALALSQTGIPFELIPGISSFSSVGGLAGIPLTHRGVSRSVLLIEGHTVLKYPPDWNSLANFQGTLVIFMGTKNIQWIAGNLLEHGARTDLPVALVETDAQQHQHLQKSSLGEVAKSGVSKLTDGPGIIYVGDVVSLSEEIGATQINTSTGEQNGRTLAHLS